VCVCVCMCVCVCVCCGGSQQFLGPGRLRVATICIHSFVLVSLSIYFVFNSNDLHSQCCVMFRIDILYSICIQPFISFLTLTFCMSSNDLYSVLCVNFSIDILYTICIYLYLVLYVIFNIDIMYE